MKKLLLALLLASTGAGQVALCQNQPGAPVRAPRPAAINQSIYQGSDTDQPVLQRFDLDFPGGSPRDLVSAIEKATGNPLNALIPQEAETLELPPMKFKAITVPDLFTALTMATQKTEVLNGGHYTSAYTFQTQGHGPDAIWYFRDEKPPRAQEFCRFYQLADDLKNCSIEDITTAIQTGWKMLGIKSPPQLKFHAETKLLIGVGELEQLATIDAVLQELRKAPKLQQPDQKKGEAPAK